jgi:hypothetical protein
VKLWAWVKQHCGPRVIVPGIAASIVAAILYEWWPRFLDVGKIVCEVAFGYTTILWGWLSATTPVYRWLYAILAISAVSSLIALAYPRMRRYLKPEEPDIRQYCQDKIFDIVWRWAYAGPDGKITSLLPFCPKCDRPLEWKDGNPNNLHGGKRTFGSYDCREHKRIAMVSEPYQRFKLTVANEIAVKARNGSWKKAFKRRK